MQKNLVYKSYPEIWTQEKTIRAKQELRIICVLSRRCFIIYSPNMKTLRLFSYASRCPSTLVTLITCCTFLNTSIANTEHIFEVALVLQYPLSTHPRESGYSSCTLQTIPTYILFL